MNMMIVNWRIIVKAYLKSKKVYGLRIFFALQRNELKTGEDWFKNMYRLECEAEEVPFFRDIAFFHHIILKRG